MKHQETGENNMSDFWETAPILGLIISGTIFFCGLGVLIYEGVEKEHVRYERCIAANMQWINRSCVK